MLPVTRKHGWTGTTVEPFNRLRREFDTLFDRAFSGTDGAFAHLATAGVPLALWEDEDQIVIEADLPGVAEGDVDITVHNGMLFLRGERKPEEGRRYHYYSRSYGRFEQVVALPTTVQTDNVQAKLTNGVLTLRLAKSPEAKPRKITIQGE